MSTRPFDVRWSIGSRRVRTMLGRAARWLLISIVLCLALIGFLQVTRGTAMRHVRGVGADGVPIGVNEPQFRLVVTMLTGAWLAPGNRVQVLSNGDETYPRLWEDLRSARESITLQLYYGNTRRMANMLASILRESRVYGGLMAAEIVSDSQCAAMTYGLFARACASPGDARLNRREPELD